MVHISDFRFLNADYKINRRGAKGKGQDKRIKVKRKDKEEMHNNKKLKRKDLL